MNLRQIHNKYIRPHTGLVLPKDVRFSSWHELNKTTIVCRDGVDLITYASVTIGKVRKCNSHRMSYNTIDSWKDFKIRVFNQLPFEETVWCLMHELIHVDQCRIIGSPAAFYKEYKRQMSDNPNIALCEIPFEKEANCIATEFVLKQFGAYINLSSLDKYALDY